MIHYQDLICIGKTFAIENFVLCSKFQNNPHMCSSVYGVLELEESCFTHALWQKKQENSAII